MRPNIPVESKAKVDRPQPTIADVRLGMSDEVRLQWLKLKAAIAGELPGQQSSK